MIMNELQNNARLVATILKKALEECNLYIAVDPDTKEFLFLDRDDYHSGRCKTARIHMEEINVRNK